MGFFDLSIPYDDSASNKTNRIKLATKAMELGYGGVAYNRTMRGVMSDRDRCSIPLLSLSSLLKVAPALASSVSLHRDLLGVPRTSPFRQYTRLTVCADSISQAQALNSGNPILKSYDLVAVRPLNQSAFDLACEQSEVDIIAIDFSERLPFRLKLPMVKAAIGRGVYFEIAYSKLVADVQVRRQMISNAKLLVDWTRGKNLIVSSAAASVNAFRGPYDVANLLSLLGISAEHAKASISRNCRTLISNALKKKQFYKDAIRIEAIPSTEKQDDEELWSLDWDKWDPISSGTGDLRLEDLEKPPLASSEVSNSVKAIDFASVIETMPSCGFQVKDLTPETGIASHTTTDGKSLLSSSIMVDNDMSVETKETSKSKIPSDISLEQKSLSHEVSEEPLLVTETIDDKEDPFQADTTTAGDSLIEPLIPNETVDTEDSGVHSESSEDEFLSLNMPDELDETEVNGLESGRPLVVGDDIDVPLQHESSTIDTAMRDVDLLSPVDDINLSICQINEECRHFESPVRIDNDCRREDRLSFKTDGDFQNLELTCEKDKTALSLDVRSSADASTGENQTDTVLLDDRLPDVVQDKMEYTSCTVHADNNLSSDQMKISTDSSSINDKLLLEAGLESQKQGVMNTEFLHLIPSPSLSAGRVKARRPLRAVPFPFKRQLSLLISKKPGRRNRRRI